jgi:electron transport complex protein RnfG
LKTIFNWRPMWPFVALMVLSLVSPAEARELWKRDALLHDMFPTSDHVEAHAFVLTDAEVAEAKGILGYAPKADWSVVVASTADHTDGYVVFDDQRGQHEPITFAVQLTTAGVVVRDEVVEYREQYGDGVIDKRFRDQFIGKSADDALIAGKDVKIVSGATYSSRALAIGVRRAALIARFYARDGATATN